MKHSLIAVLLIVGCPLSAAAENLALVRDGQPRAVLVLSATLKPQDFSAKALISHVQQMSGATLPTIKESEFSAAKIENGRAIPPAGKTSAETFILLGESELTRQLGFSLDGIGPGGIVVATRGNAIVLLAKHDGLDNGRYPVHARAVYRFLESLGCRCLWPGVTGKVIPQRRTIAVAPLNVRFTPPIGQRNIRFSRQGPGGYEQGLAYLGFTDADRKSAWKNAAGIEGESDWGAWNGIGGNIGISGGHAGGGLRGGWETHGKDHPEWFALQSDGTRDQNAAGGRWRLCISNQGLVEHVAADILARFEGKPQPAISLSPNDGGLSNFCMCEACKKLDPPDGPKIRMLMFAKVGQGTRSEIDYVSLSDRFVHYWNAVAQRVTKVVPDQLFVVDAYSYYSDPPVREKLHPNLVVRYVPSDIEGWKGWQAAGAKRSYWRPNNLHGGYREGAIKPTARKAAESLKYLTAQGMLATDISSIYDNWATQGLEYYTAARLSWDPSQDFDALVDDYCRTGFSSGAEQVKKYFALVESGVTPVVINNRGQFPKIEPATIDALRALLVAAAQATVKDAPSHQRVAFLRAGLELTAISAEAHRLKNLATAGETVDLPAAHALLERRWQLMRALFQQQPLAVNVAVVAGHDRQLNEPLKWKGPTEAAKAGKFQLLDGDDWLNEDQSATRKK